MEFVRQVVNSNTLTSVLDLPPSFHGVQVEVIVMPVDDNTANQRIPSLVHGSGDSIKPVKHSAFGRLKAYANPSLIPEEKGAWEKATAEKYALH